MKRIKSRKLNIILGDEIERGSGRVSEKRLTLPEIIGGIMVEALRGKKTYIVCIAMIAYAITGYVSGKLDLNSAIQIILEAFAICGLRLGISKVSKP